jgi:hypothetical protein
MSEENRKSLILPLIIISILFVLVVFVSYWIWLPDIKCLLNNPPENTSPIQITGTFGDSFGFLTCLFSGLSWVGVIIAVLMQREELQLQRKNSSESTESQRKIAKLQALSAMLTQYMRMRDDAREEKQEELVQRYIDVITDIIVEIDKELRGEFNIQLNLYTKK